ncbi:MAG: ABC transporter permease subunit [Candidatus Aquicultorales bacterium]
MAIKAIAWNVIREAFRQKILYVTLLFSLMLLALEPMLPSFKVGLRIQLFQDLALGVAYLAMGILAVALSINQVPKEIEKRTIHNVLSKPVRRGDYLVGKYIGVVVVLALCGFLMALSVVGFAYANFGTFSTGLFEGMLTASLEAALIAAFAILISTFASPTVNVFACILFYFAGHVKNDALAAMTEAGGPPSILAAVFKYAFPSLENFNVNEAVARGLLVRPAFMLELLVYTVAFAAIFLMIGAYALGRKEL